jgi:hypothetical protein
VPELAALLCDCFSSLLKTKDLRESVQRWNNLSTKSVFIGIEDE